MSTEFKIQQSEEYKGSDWWKWAVWVEGTDAALDQIEHVEWTLHPTFPNPIRKVDDRSQKFKIETGGWGTFPIQALVLTKDGKSFRLRHNLSLFYPDGAKTPATQEGSDTENDNYQGDGRSAAKLSVGNGPIESFDEIKDLIDSLPTDSVMMRQVPQNTTYAGRVDEEQRNIRVRAFLYAARKDRSNDFNLIVGRAPRSKSEMYMKMVVSGLPSSISQAFPQLSAVRAAFKDFFGAGLPSENYDFYNPPIPVEVEGSLFFNHATVQKSGPKALKAFMPKSSWEVHPITRIVIPADE